jgi:hypothetical protein
MKVRLTRKLAQRINGIDLSTHQVGDMIDLPLEQARLIVVEGWGHADRRVLVTTTDYRRRSEDRAALERSKPAEPETPSVAADRRRRDRSKV